MGCPIDIKDYSAKRGDFLLKNINLQIKAGEIFAILGKTGAGKTVLLEAITGLFPGISGSVSIDNVPVCSIPIQERRIGFVYQDYQLFPHMNVFQNISYGMKMNKFPRKEIEQRTGELMEMLGITHIKNQFPQTLSGGEQQRTAFARALALNPEILLLDEPFSALDPVTKETLYGILLDIHKKFGCTIVFVSHDFHEAERLAERVAILINGELRAVIQGEELLTGKNHDTLVNEFLGIV